VTGVQTCALPISRACATPPPPWRRLAAPPRLRRDTTRPRAPGAAAARSTTALRPSDVPVGPGEAAPGPPSSQPPTAQREEGRCGTPALPTPRTSPRGQVRDDLVPNRRQAPRPPEGPQAAEGQARRAR